MDSRKVTGFALLDGQVVHLSVFDRPKNEEEGPAVFPDGEFSNRGGTGSKSDRGQSGAGNWVDPNH